MVKGRALSYAGAVAVPLGAGVLLHLWTGWATRSPLGLPNAVADGVARGAPFVPAALLLLAAALTTASLRHELTGKGKRIW